MFGFKRGELKRSGGNSVMLSLMICTSHTILFNDLYISHNIVS